MIATLALAPALSSAQMNGFYRFPSLHGDQVWFTAEGDIWRVAASGGRAERVTTGPRAETRPSVSPDGKWLAFNGSYEGPNAAYVMAVDGGVPKRLTFGGLNATVSGWAPGGEVIVTAPSTTGAPNNQLFAINPSTLATRVFPVALATDGALAADGKTLYFLTSVRLAPDGEHAAFTARGRIATQGVGAMRRAELPVPASTPCREAVYDADAQLDSAIAHLKARLVEQPIVVPVPPKR